MEVMKMHKPIFCTISGADKCSFGLDEKHPDCISLKLRLLTKIADLYSEGVTDFVCNCEIGIPLWAAEMVLCSKSCHNVKLNIVTPYETQAALWTDEWRERYYTIHEKADSVTILNKQFSDTSYNDCNRYMIDNSDILLWAGSESSDIIDYSREQKKAVIYLASETILM